MTGAPSKLSAKAWWMLARWTVCGTLGCLAVSLVISYLLFRDVNGRMLQRILFNSTVLPIVLAGPLFFFLTLKLRELAVANHKLAVVAATDGLTNCLNRSAFSSAVEAALSARRDGDTGTGALLVIDADHFKSINDRFGHDQGDHALRLIAASIRSSVRAGDLVGRIGGEEFAVFLAGTSPAIAADVAERIRRSVNEAVFEPYGRQHCVSVSVGGAFFDRNIEFEELFRFADRLLYEAKQGGRNRVELSGPGSERLSVHLSAAVH